MVVHHELTTSHASPLLTGGCARPPIIQVEAWPRLLSPACHRCPEPSHDPGRRLSRSSHLCPGDVPQRRRLRGPHFYLQGALFRWVHPPRSGFHRRKSKSTNDTSSETRPRAPGCPHTGDTSRCKVALTGLKASTSKMLTLDSGLSWDTGAPSETQLGLAFTNARGVSPPNTTVESTELTAGSPTGRREHTPAHRTQPCFPPPPFLHQWRVFPFGFAYIFMRIRAFYEEESYAKAKSPPLPHTELWFPPMSPRATHRAIWRVSSPDTSQAVK